MPFDNVMIEPSKEHVGFGVNDLNPLTSSDGQEVFLEQGELSVQCGSVHLESKSSHQPRTKLIEGSGESLFIREKRDHESVIDENGEGVWRTDVDLAIPYTNENVMLLYREALKHPKGVLIIDCTNPRVSVSGNVFEKASLVQNLFWREGFEVAVVVSVGDGISYRLAGVANGWCCAKDVTLGNAIERIDLQCGLETPVFVFGYHKLNRCVSVRSSQRVPTHICVHRGAATSIEDVFQTLGRGTGLFRNRLEENGFKNGVTILTTEADLQMFRRLAHFVEKVSASEDIGAIFEGRSVELPGSFDFLTCSRRIGKRKETRGNLEKIFKRQKAARSPALLLGPSGLGLARYDNVSLVHETQEKIIDLT